MISIEERASQFDFIAYPTYDTLPTIYTRIRALLDTGRRATLIRYYRSAAIEPDVRIHPSLTPDWYGGPLPSYLPSALVEDPDARTRYFEIGFWPGLEQISLRGDDTTEETVAERFLDGKPSTRVEFNGLGQGTDDYVQLTTWNQHGVCLVTRLQLENRTQIIGEIPDGEVAEDDNEFTTLDELLESMTTPERPSSFLMMAAHMLDSLVSEARHRLGEQAGSATATAASWATHASTVAGIAAELDALADNNPAIRALALCVSLISGGDDTTVDSPDMWERRFARLANWIANRSEGTPDDDAGPRLRLVDDNE
ncbi:hypothetical protein [Mycobacteroides abscessus]|uniref:hypothetical protein n=1 Tax=Mycobacteroides abscessus TaxID=36809 RepID=UPI0018964C0C